MQAKNLIFLGLSLVLAACSGGGRTLVPNQQCAANYDPVPMTLTPDDQKNKVEWEKTTDTLPPGDYQEIGGFIYYVDDERAATNQNFRVKIQESQQKDGSYQVDSGANCARNARPGLKLDFATEGVTRMTIDNNKNVTDVETRMFKFTTDQSIKGKFDPPQKKTGIDPKAIYAGKTTNSYIYRRGDTDVEVRATGRYDNGNTHGTYYILTTLRRVGTPACSDASPLATTVDKATEESKLPLDQIGKVAKGVYTVVSTSVYVVDVAQNYRLQVQDKPTDKGVADSRVMCERNVNDQLQPKSFVVTDAISKVTVDDAGTADIEYAPRRLSYQRVIEKDKPSRTAVQFKPVDATANLLAPTDVELRAVVGTPIVYRTGDQLEIRSRATTTSGGLSYTYDVTTILRRKN